LLDPIHFCTNVIVTKPLGKGEGRGGIGSPRGGVGASVCDGSKHINIELLFCQ